MGAELFEEGFNPHAEFEQIYAAADKLRERSFYTGILVDTFFDHTDQTTIVTAKDDRYENYAIGGRIKEKPLGVMRLLWSTYSSTRSVKLIIAQAPFRDPYLERQLLLDSESYLHPHTIETNGRASGFMLSPNEDGTWTQRSLDNISISIFPVRTHLAPSDPDNNFNYWLLKDFVPHFLDVHVSPLANIPKQEMVIESLIDNPEV